MPMYRTTQPIASSPEIVWERISNVVAWPVWLPTVSSVTPLDANSLQLGARFRVTQPKLRPAIWRVTDLQPGRAFVWQSGAPGLAMEATHVVRPTGPTDCELTLEFRFSGLIAPLVALFAGAITQRYIETEAATCKTLAENR